VNKGTIVAIVAGFANIAAIAQKIVANASQRRAARGHAPDTLNG
jgi:hypothetical protein